MILKKALTAVALCAAAIGLTSCETQTLKGNHNVGMGNMTYYYAYVQSHVIAPAYYHIAIWKEYGPDPDGGGRYVGLEFETFTYHTHYYFYEYELSYILTREYVSTFGTAIE